MELKRKELTVKEAINQGYTKYGFGSREWQTTEDLHDDIFNEVKEEDWPDLFLFSKESDFPSITATQIADRLSDSIAEDDCDESGRPDGEVYDTVAAIDYTEIAAKINDALKKHEYWMLTNIKNY